jgi:hypothetical protein
MLIENKSFTKGSVVTIKVLGGDELVARLDEEYTIGGPIRVVKPLVVMMGQQGFGMMPFMLTAQSEAITVQNQSILGVAKTIKEVADEYLKQTTGLMGMA